MRSRVQLTVFAIATLTAISISNHRSNRAQEPADADVTSDAHWIKTIEEDLKSDKPSSYAPPSKVVSRRLEVLTELYENARKQYEAGERSLESTLDILHRWAEAQLMASQTDAERNSAHKKQIAFLDDLAKSKRASTRSRQDALFLEAATLDAQVTLDREKMAPRVNAAAEPALRKRAELLRLALRKTFSLYIEDAIGGEAYRVARFGRDWCLAGAEHSLACGDKPSAIAYLKRALEYAKWHAAMNDWTHTSEDVDQAVAAHAEIYEIEAQLYKVCPECSPAPGR